MPAEVPLYKRKRILVPAGLLFITGILLLLYHLATIVRPPEPADLSPLNRPVLNPDSGFLVCGDSWLKQGKSGLWELYLQGSPFDRGVANGKLTRQLLFEQESAFVRQIRELVPSAFQRWFLKYFIYLFNRKMDRFLMDEFRQEIYGISLSASDSFRFIGNAYRRMLNYHSAHDIGHALQELGLVGCTSFAIWDEFTEDSALMIGRNFDFYAGDDFAKIKIVCFEKPDHGYGFMMITWAGMIGCVSGMNDQGLTVTINAARSKIPFSARTPISLLAREILQYAATIGDAYRIAEERQTFISESILIGSGEENRAAIIEKTPDGVALVESSQHLLVCTNHFQSSRFSSEPLNQQALQDQSSLYRYRRVIQDITHFSPLDESKAAMILRDRNGLNGSDIGMGNEKAINQLIAHHSVIFKPGDRLVWISTSPWQIGEYVCYDLRKIFHTFAPLRKCMDITEEELTIQSDPFLGSAQYENFLRFREMRAQLIQALNQETAIGADTMFFAAFHSANPRFYEVWSLSGDYYTMTGQRNQAQEYYRTALTLEIPRWSEKEKIIRKLTECSGKK